VDIGEVSGLVKTCSAAVIQQAVNSKYNTGKGD
jgi:hypothetical protein